MKRRVAAEYGRDFDERPDYKKTPEMPKAAMLPEPLNGAMLTDPAQVTSDPQPEARLSGIQSAPQFASEAEVSVQR